MHWGVSRVSSCWPVTLVAVRLSFVSHIKRLYHAYLGQCIAYRVFSVVSLYYTNPCQWCSCHLITGTEKLCLENTTWNMGVSNRVVGRERLPQPHSPCLSGHGSLVPWCCLWVDRCNDHEVLTSPGLLNLPMLLWVLLGLSGAVCEYVMAYTRAWSVSPICPL